MGGPSFQTAVAFNLLVLKLNAFLFSFPISVDLKKKRIRRNDSLLRKVFWNFGLGLLAFKTAYVTGAFAAASKSPELYNELHYPLHFVFVTGHLLAAPVGHVLFNAHRNSFILAWNTLLTDLPSVGINSPMQLQLALVYPVMTTVGVLASAVMFALDGSWVHQLEFFVTAMRERGYWGHDWTFMTASIVAQAVDAYTLMMIPALVCCLAISHIGAFEVTNAVNRKWIQDAATTPSETNCRNLKKLQMMIRNLNDCLGPTIYIDKLVCMYTGVCGLSAILLATFVHPVTTTMTAYIAVSCITKYPTVCHKAYPIYENMQELKRLTLLRSSGTLTHRLVAKTVVSVHNEGISVGGFRRFDRDTFLVYGDFIVSTVANILISSK